MADRNLTIRMLFDAADRVSRPLRDIMGGSRRAADALRDTRDALRGINNQQGQVQAFRTLRSQMRGSEQAMQAAQARATALGREMAQTTNPARAMSRAFEQAKREAAQLTAQHRTQTRQLQDLRTRLRATGIETRDLARHERELRDRARDTTRAMEQQSRALERATRRQQRLTAARERFDQAQGRAGNVAGAGTGMIGAAVATAAPLVAAGKVAMDLEEGMAGVAKVTGMARGELATMSSGVVELSTRIPMTAVELSNIASAAGAAGVGLDKFGRPLRTQRDDLLTFTEDAAQMGIAFDMSAEDAGSTMAKWRQAFRMTQPEVRALGDRINALTNQFGGSASATAGLVTRVGPLAKVAGLGASSVAALGSSLNAMGIEEEIAATGIKNMLLALTKGDAATKAQSKSLQALGLNAGDVARKMQLDAEGTIVDVLDRIAGLRPEKQASLLSELFGSESVSAIAPLLTGLDGVKERLKLVADQSRYAGSMTGEFMNRIGTTTGMTKQAANAFTAAGIGLGQTLLPNIRAAALRFAAAMLRLRAFTLRHPDLTRNLMLVAAGLSIVLGAAGALTLGYAALIGPMAIIGALSTATGIAMAPMIAIVLAVVAAIAALGYIAYQIYQNWNPALGFFGNLWAGIKWLFTDGILALGKSIMDWNPLGIFYRAFAGVMGWFGIEMPGKFTDFGRMLISGLIGGITGMLGALKSTIVNAASSAANWFKSKLGIRSPSRVFAGFGGFMMQGLERGIDRGAGGPLDRITRLSRELSGAMAIGAATPALAAGGAVSNSGGPAGAPVNRTYNITINATGGGAADIEAAVRRAIEQVEREQRAAAYSSFADRPDWNV